MSIHKVALVMGPSFPFVDCLVDHYVTKTTKSYLVSAAAHSSFSLKSQHIKQQAITIRSKSYCLGLKCPEDSLKNSLELTV